MVRLLAATFIRHPGSQGPGKQPWKNRGVKAWNLSPSTHRQLVTNSPGPTYQNTIQPYNLTTALRDSSVTANPWLTTQSDEFYGVVAVISWKAGQSPSEAQFSRHTYQPSDWKASNLHPRGPKRNFI